MEVLFLLIAVIIVGYILYFVIKSSVRNGIIEAYIEIELSKRKNSNSYRSKKEDE